MLNTEPTTTIDHASESETARLDVALFTMEHHARMGDVHSCDAAWDAFTIEIERHLSSLRRHLTPLLGVAGEEARAAASASLAEIDAVGRRVGELGLLLQVHAAGASEVLALLTTLRERVRHQRATLVSLLFTTATGQSLASASAA